MNALEFHRLADIFPLVEGQEFDDLVADIRAWAARADCRIRGQNPRWPQPLSGLHGSRRRARVHCLHGRRSNLLRDFAQSAPPTLRRITARAGGGPARTA